MWTKFLYPLMWSKSSKYCCNQRARPVLFPQLAQWSEEKLSHQVFKCSVRMRRPCLFQGGWCVSSLFKVNHLCGSNHQTTAASISWALLVCIHLEKKNSKELKHCPLKKTGLRQETLTVLLNRNRMGPMTGQSFKNSSCRSVCCAMFTRKMQLCPKVSEFSVLCQNKSWCTHFVFFPACFAGEGL